LVKLRKFIGFNAIAPRSRRGSKIALAPKSIGFDQWPPARGWPQ
jgi:hypothetical protein